MAARAISDLSDLIWHIWARQPGNHLSQYDHRMSLSGDIAGVRHDGPGELHFRIFTFLILTSKVKVSALVLVW